jgi:serine/threonine protein kinase
MSPEQAQGHKLDHRSDIYSLGITCWHALTGKPPFSGGTALAVALQHVNNTPPSLGKLRPDISPALVAIVERMIEKKPTNRFQTFHGILQELHNARLTSDKPFVTTKPDFPQQSARYTLQRALELRRTRFRRMISVVLFSLLLSLLGLSLGYAYRTWIDPPFGKSRTLSVPQKSTVEEQWIYACYLNTPDAWQSVIDFFPEEEFFWGHKAKRQLIRYYFYNDDTSHNSFQLFWNIGTLAYSDLEEQMLGLAGAAWCAAVNVPDIKVAQGYLNEIQMLRAQHGLPVDWFPDGLSRRIYEAAEKIIQQKEGELPAGTVL